jgi:Salt tolerance down-regulator
MQLRGGSSRYTNYCTAASYEKEEVGIIKAEEVYMSENNNNNNNNKKTGFDYIDNLSKEDRIKAFNNVREHWLSLTPEERTQYLDDYYTAIREKMKSKSGLITHDEAIKEIINVDFPKIKEEAIKEAEQNGRFDIAEDLKRKERFGIDYLATNLISEEE